MSKPAAKILIIVTTHAALGDTGRKTGLWFEELAVPYYVFTDAGAEVTVASVSGGPVPMDPRSMEENGKQPASVERFMNDAEAMRRIGNTPKIDETSAQGYDAVFLPGGHGAMGDLAESPALGELLTRAWADGKVVSAVCHGPAGLIRARDASGRPLVSGRQVSAFTDAEEKATGLDKVVPFALETKLRSLGAQFRPGPNFQPQAVRDGRLVTGQNPASSERVARLVL